MESHTKALRVAVWIAVLVCAPIFIVVGIGKFDGAWIGRFESWGYRPNFSRLIGALELLGAIALLIPITSIWAALGLTIIMFGALWTQIGDGDWVAALAPSTMIALLGFVVFGRIVLRPVRA